MLTPEQTSLSKMLKLRLKEKNLRIQVILGPRQVGKTTFMLNFIRNAKSDFHYANGDGVSQSVWIIEKWAEAHDKKKILVIDEIQKIPDWSEVIKKLWDENQQQKNKMKVILLGSSSLSLQKGLSESLTGRFEQIIFHHWNYASTLGLKKIKFADFLIYGGYPGSYEYINNSSRWQDFLRTSIVETVIGKDILMQAKVKSPALFRQCFYVLMNLPAQVMSYNKILGQLQDRGNIDQVKYYIDLFEAAFLLKTVHKFSKNEIRKKQSSPKIIPLAPSLSCFHRMDNLNTDYRGHVFEALVGAQLLKFKADIYYWAEGDYEVDYVLEIGSKLVAIEVKSGRNKKSSSLKKYLEKNPASKIVFIDFENYPEFEKDPLGFIGERI